MTTLGVVEEETGPGPLSSLIPCFRDPLGVPPPLRRPPSSQTSLHHVGKAEGPRQDVALVGPDGVESCHSPSVDVTGRVGDESPWTFDPAATTVQWMDERGQVSRPRVSSLTRRFRRRSWVGRTSKGIEVSGGRSAGKIPVPLDRVVHKTNPQTCVRGQESSIGPTEMRWVVPSYLSPPRDP